MNEEETRRFYEVMEAAAICQAITLLIQQVEDAGIEDEEHRTMLIFFRRILQKYRRKAALHQITISQYGRVKIEDNVLRKFNTN